MDLFAPCNFANIQGYPHDLPDNGLDKLPSFQGNNVVSVKAHLKAFSSWLGKYAKGTDYNHEDVKMSLFVLSLEEDALDWFMEKLDNSFDSLQSILTTFKDKYGDKREERYLLRAINTIKKNENETVEEFNKSFNGIVRELPQDYKPTDKSLLEYYLDAFNNDTSYELIRVKPNDYRAAQTLDEEMEQCRKASGKSKIPGFDRGPSKSHDSKGKEIKEVYHDPIKELTQMIKNMEINQAKKMSNHPKEISAMQARLVQMERSQAQNIQPRNNQNNNAWQKRGPSNEQRPPIPLESTHLVEEAPPYCRACNALHDEATCPTVRRIMDSGMIGTSNQINIVDDEHHLSMQDWMEVVENSHDVKNLQSSYSIITFDDKKDMISKLFGENPSSDQILEIARDKGLTYQWRNKAQCENQITPKVPNPGLNSNSGLNIYLGGWINNAKILVPVIEIIKIPSQKANLLKAIDAPRGDAFHEKTLEVGYQDTPVYLQSMELDNKDHQPFYITLLINGFRLYNCMLDFGASVCVMTKRVMEQLNLRISRPYHNICAMDSKRIEVHGLIKDLQVHLSVYFDIMISMDIVVIDVPDTWGMLLSRKWASDLGGSIQMN